MKKMLPLLLLLLCIHAIQCKKDHNTPAVVKNLHTQCPGCEIQICSYNKDMIYGLSLNAMDAGTQYYNGKGEMIIDCNAAWGPADPLCEQIHSCRVIYRPKDFMGLGLPVVDKYSLDD
jgi:hypothetical protein